MFKDRRFKPKIAGSDNPLDGQTGGALEMESGRQRDRTVSKVNMLKTMARYHPDKNMQWRPDPDSALDPMDNNARYCVLCEEVSISPE